MRFLYYDKVTHLEKGKSITGVKAFPLSEEYLRAHFSKEPLIPGVILIEAMAQLLGWLIILSHDFKLSAIMTLVEGVTIHKPRLAPGFLAQIHGEILSTSRRDSLGRAWITVDGQTIATLDRIIYTHFHQVDPSALETLFRYYGGFACNSSPGKEGAS